MDMMRHVAKIAQTDQRCVVAFLQIPNREDHALVIPTDSLPPRMEQAVMDVLKTSEGQTEENFGLALSRHLLPDTGQNILEALHAQNRLIPVPVDQVLMLPRPNHPIKLRTVLESMGRMANAETNDLMQTYQVEKFNPHTQNQRAETDEQRRAIANNLIAQAEMLEADARRKRQEAYSFEPSLRPKEMKLPEIERGREMIASDTLVKEASQPKPAKRKKTAGA